MVLSFDNDQGVLTTPRVDLDNLRAISLFKDSFVKKNQNTTLSSLLEPEIAASWQRCKGMKVDPYMEELTYMRRSMELNALLRDKRKFIDLTKMYFSALLPLLNLPTTLTIFDENGTLLDLTDQPRLLRLNPHSGSIWREETVGTSSTSLCLEYGKTVLLAGSRHYCKALEHQLATSSPVCDAQGNQLGVITTINHINDAALDDETLHRILLWTNTLRYTVESQLELSKRSHSVGSGNTLYPSRFEEDRTLDRSFAGIKGESPQLHTAVRTAARFARTDNGILITGESGTGKEMFAQAIHQASGRSGSFVAINCAALPSNLIASELFGYVGGAFTGAENKGRVGKIELAHEGTLFLDEIGDMPLEIQPTFLRVLEDKKVMRLGSNKDVHVDFRLVAATNCDLFKLVQEKKFRADLYYRLEILQLALPPLRERGQDSLLMANYFLEQSCRKAGCPPFMLSREAEVFILNYPWPGNIRQLKNAMVYAANICESQVIKMQDLPVSLYRNIEVATPNEPSDKFPQMTSIHETEEEMIRKALTLTGNNVRVAANLVGLSKTTVYRKIKEYNIQLL